VRFTNEEFGIRNSEFPAGSPEALVRVVGIPNSSFLIPNSCVGYIQ